MPTAPEKTCPCGAPLSEGGPLTVCWSCFDVAHEARLRASRIADLERQLRTANEAIEAAYWRFSRCARALPPSSAVPRAYAARKDLEAELRDLRLTAAADGPRCACGGPLEANGPGQGFGCAPCAAAQHAAEGAAS